MKDELDILREAGSIAAAHGSIALSEIIGRKINLKLPSLEIVPCKEGPKTINLEHAGIAIFAKILIGLQGQVVFILDEKNAFSLIDLSPATKAEGDKSGVITEMGLSFIKEVGNIVTSAYLNALSLMIKRMIIPPLPTLVSGSIENILNIILSPYADDDFAYIVEAVFEEPQAKINGSFYLILTPEAAKDVKKACRALLEDIGR